MRIEADFWMTVKITYFFFFIRPGIESEQLESIPADADY